MRPANNAHPAWRLAALSAASSLWVAVGSPMGVLDHQLVTAHVVRHRLLMIVAAPLILQGEPAIRPSLNPVLCWLVSTAVVIGWHIPAQFELGMQSEASHEIEQLVSSRRVFCSGGRNRAGIPVVHSFVPVPGHATVRRAFRISGVCGRVGFLRITSTRIGPSTFHLSKTRKWQAR